MTILMLVRMWSLVVGRMRVTDFDDDDDDDDAVTLPEYTLVAGWAVPVEASRLPVTTAY